MSDILTLLSNIGFCEEQVRGGEGGGGLSGDYKSIKFFI